MFQPEWPLQSPVAAEHLRKHQLEPTRGDLMNPVDVEEWQMVHQSLDVRYD